MSTTHDYKELWNFLKSTYGDSEVMLKAGGKLIFDPKKHNILKELMDCVEEYKYHLHKKETLEGVKKSSSDLMVKNEKNIKVINLKTSYYGNHRNFKDYKALSISTTQPPGCSFNDCPELMPSRVDLVAYKGKRISENDFTIRYLVKLRRLKENSNFFEEIEDGILFLCWEKVGKFCHRQILSKYLNSVNIPGIKFIVNELDNEKESTLKDSEKED